MLSLSRGLADVIRSIDASDIVSARPLTANRRDIVVSCASGLDHLVRFEEEHVSLLRQKWGCEQMQRARVGCPRVEAFLPPSEAFPSGCMVISWLPGIPADHLIRRYGPGEAGYQLCRMLGGALRRLHTTLVHGPIPDYVFVQDRASAHRFMTSCLDQLRQEGLVDAAFKRKAVRLLEPYLERIPDPYPHTLCFTDMHFHNVLVADADPSEVVGFVDVEGIAVGWAMWDFTNWECWGLRFGLSWTREHILTGYGPLDLEMYRFALLIRLARPFTFSGSIREQIVDAVESQDLRRFDLARLYP